MTLGFSLKPDESTDNGDARKKKNNGMGMMIAAAAMKIGLLKALAFKALVLLVGKALLVSKVSCNHEFQYSWNISNIFRTMIQMMDISARRGISCCELIFWALMINKILLPSNWLNFSQLLFILSNIRCRDSLVTVRGSYFIAATLNTSFFTWSCIHGFHQGVTTYRVSTQFL